MRKKEKEGERESGTDNRGKESEKEIKTYRGSGEREGEKVREGEIWRERESARERGKERE